MEENHDPVSKRDNNPVESLGDSEAAQAESEREITIELLRLLTRKNGRHELMRSVTALLHSWSGCEAVGIRLHEGDDFPYFETRGFPAEFVRAENRLCAVDASGTVERDDQGNPVLVCMCGVVLRGRFDPSQPFFTAHGSFWTNSTSQLLATTTARTRNRCYSEGYESVALIPLRASDETFGLLQLNDRRPGQFSPAKIALFERLADSLTLGLAHRHAQETLRESKSRLQTAIRAGSVGLWEWNLSANRVLHSLESKRPAGDEDQEFAHDFAEWQNRVHPDDLDRCLRSVTAFIEKPWPDFRLEFRYRYEDGSYRSLLAQASLEMDEAGKAVRILGAYIDITDRKRAEEALRVSEERFRDLAELLPQTIYEADLEGRLTFVNRESLQMFGYTREEVEAGLNCFDTLAAKDRERARETFLRAAQGEDVGGVEFTAQRKDGTQFSVVIHGAPILRAGQTVGLRGIIIDVTDRKRAEEALRESEERFRLTFDQLPIGAAISSLDYRFLRVNEMLCRITGYSSEELIGRPFPDITHPDDRVRDLQLAQRLVAGEIDHYEIDKRYIRKDGKVVWIRLVSRLAKTASGQPLYFLPTMQDITGRKLAEERMREAERLSANAERLAIAGQMAAQVAHEINNPLAGIKNSFRLIKNAVPADHPDRDMVGRIEREIDRIARIVRQMYQIYSPRVEERIDISVRETVRDVVELLEPLRRQHEVTIEMETIPPELTVRAYEGSLQQVLFNLTANALQASPARGKVEISAIPTDNNFVEILVCDHGHGISAEIQDRIFEPFFSTESVDSTKKGLGLGLPIVNTIVSNLGGKIDFQSTIGEGTCFRVFLPRKQL